MIYGADIESRILHKDSAEAKEQVLVYGEPKTIPGAGWPTKDATSWGQPNIP